MATAGQRRAALRGVVVWALVGSLSDAASKEIQPLGPYLPPLCSDFLIHAHTHTHRGIFKIHAIEK